MTDTQQKVQLIFANLAGDRARELTAAIPQAQDRIRSSIAEEFSILTAQDIAFHLTDWQSDAAFIVALTLFPEQFSDEEVKEGLEDFLVHAPNHIAAAAKLSGHPVEDIFGVGALCGPSK